MFVECLNSLSFIPHCQCFTALQMRQVELREANCKKFQSEYVGELHSLIPPTNTFWAVTLYLELGYRNEQDRWHLCLFGANILVILVNLRSQSLSHPQAMFFYCMTLPSTFRPTLLRLVIIGLPFLKVGGCSDLTNPARKDMYFRDDELLIGVFANISFSLFFSVMASRMLILKTWEFV